MSDSTLFDQAVANLRRLSGEIRAAGDPACLIPTQAVPCWADKLDSAVADLLEVQRRARYGEVLAVGAALVDVTLEGPAVVPNAQQMAGGGGDRAAARPRSSSGKVAPRGTRNMTVQ